MSSIPKSPVTPTKALWPPPSPPQTGDAALLERCRKLEVECGKLKSAQCVWDSQWTAYSRKLEAAEHAARDAERRFAASEAECAWLRAAVGGDWTDYTRKLEAAERAAAASEAECERLRAEAEPRSRASTLDGDDESEELAAARSRASTLDGDDEELAAARALIAVLERQLERRTAESRPDERRRDPSTPPPPPPPSSPLSSQSCPTPVISQGLGGSRLWSMIARPGLLWLPPELQEIALSRELDSPGVQ